MRSLLLTALCLAILLFFFSVANADVYSAHTVKQYLEDGVTDTYIKKTASSTNYGSADTLLTYFGAMDWEVREHILLLIDLSSIPSSITNVDSFYIRLWRTSGAYAQMNLGRITNPWTESEATWTNRKTSPSDTAWSSAGGDYDDNSGSWYAALTEVGSSGADYIEFAGGSGSDLCELVEDLIDGTLDNYGFFLRAANTKTLTIASYEHSTVTYRPFAYIEYTPASITGEDTLTVHKDDMVDTYLDEDAPTTVRNETYMYTSIDVSDDPTNITILQFDVSDVPSGSTIDSTALIIMERPFGGADIGTDGDLYYIHQVTNPWGETEATWNNRKTDTAWTASGGDYEAVPVDSFTIAPIGSAFNWLFCNSPDGGGLTELVEDWVNGTEDNYGIAIIKAAGSSTDVAKFNSSDNVGGEGGYATVMPKLYIEYTEAEASGITARRKKLISQGGFSD